MSLDDWNKKNHFLKERKKEKKSRGGRVVQLLLKTLKAFLLDISLEVLF